jgi:hypothetical protein
MHIIEQYALSCGVKIDKPQITDAFFPLKEKKYITFHSHAKFDSRNYSFLQEVINLINAPLSKEGVEVIQLGIKEDPSVAGINDLRGKCTINQTAYVVKNSLLHFGVDSFLIHLAGYYNIPLVGLYSNMHKEQSGPYWGGKDNQVLIQSPRGNNKPSYAPQENPKTINKIMPEEIARNILDLLKIKHDVDKIETIHMGQHFSTNSIEIVPDFTAAPEFFNGRLVNLRMDLHFNESAMLEWGKTRKLSIITNKEINVNYVAAIKDNIEQFSLEINEGISHSYLKNLRKVVKTLKLFVKSKENLPKIRAQFIDWDIELFTSKAKKDIDNSEKICDTSLFKSSKTFMATGKRYSCRAAWEKENEFSSTAEQVLDDDIFWEDVEFFRIFNKK